MIARQPWLCLGAAVALAYAWAFPPSFQFDDFHLVVDNPDVAGWSAWAASMPGIRPLTKASFVLSRIASESAASFVAFSLACHVLASALLYGLLRRVLPPPATGATDAAAIALVAALIFALHPAQTEAVTYVSGRSVVLCGALYLAALFVAQPASRAAGTSLVSPALFALALAARETAWTLPFALLLLDTAQGRSWREALWRSRAHWVVLGAGLALFAASPVYRRLLATSLAVRDPWQNVFAQVQGIAYLISHPLATLRINFDPALEPSTRIDGPWLAAAAVLALLLAAAALTWRRERWLAVGVLWFFLHLLPTNGAVARFDFVNDRQLYLALAGPALAVALLLARLPRRPARLAATALTVALGAATAVRNTDYRSEVALWEATARASPAKARVWNNLGYAWQLRGETARARRAYLRALALDPAYARAQVNLDRLDAQPRPDR